MRGFQLSVCILCVCSINGFSQRTFTIASPSAQVKVTVNVSDSIRYSVHAFGETVIVPSPILLDTDAGIFGLNSKLSGNSTRRVNETIVNPVPYKRKNIPDNFNELTLKFKEKFSLLFRVYDDGISYRFVTSLEDSITVNDEVAVFRFNRSDTTYFPEVQPRENLDVFHTSFEEPYKKISLSGIKNNQVAFSPILINAKVKTAITESDLEDYPGMFLRGTGKSELRGLFAPYPEREEIFGGEFKQPMVVARKNYLAFTKGERTFPWRVIILAKKDADLLMNDLVYRLGKPPATDDWSWVKPGISTEEWIAGINLHGVDFKAGLNTASYKYYIDFASKTGMQYVMLDAGWSDPNDLFKVNPEMDLEEIASYSRSKNVGLIFWTLSMALEKQLDQILPVIKKLNGKVLMTDFMDRDDQKMVNFYHRIADATAKNQLMVMFHGAFKNAGLERTYPNTITREGALGSEYNIWSDKATPDHDLILPFTRMLSGPVDYEPGFMVNVNKQSFRPVADMLMSMGTRCHQLAMFVVYESPMQLFSGNPSDALKEEAYIKFLASIPTTWDETVVLDAKIGEYVVIARRKSTDWYVGAMTNWSDRELNVTVPFLGPGKFKMETVRDGINAAKYGSDYVMGSEEINSGTTLKIIMAPGGGYVAKISKQ
jgi:alpha-glucosidase